jgi:hypothetical protein
MTKQRSLKRIYHLADERNWQSILANGLLSTAQLLKRADLNEWMHRHRLDNLHLPNGVLIRDQKPMPPTALARCLANDLRPADWYVLLNNKVFFWIDLDRLERQRQACTTPQYIMTIDAQRLLEQYASHASVTPFNTGNARRAAARRGLASFVPYSAWINSGWETEAEALGTKPRLSHHQPVELTITDAVPDIFDYVIDYRLLGPGDHINLNIDNLTK